MYNLTLNTQIGFISSQIQKSSRFGSDHKPQPALYVYSGNEEARLSDQSKIMHAQTLDLLRRAGLRPEIDVLDMGCGGADVSFCLSEQVGPKGRVHAVDFNQQTIRSNQQKQDQKTHANLTFETGNAETYTSPMLYDIAFSRFVLAHLKQPGEAIARMTAATKRGGRVVIEDVDISTMDAIPSNPALNRVKELLIGVIKNKGADATIGPKLEALMRNQPGLENIQVSEHHPCGKTGPVKDVPKNVLAGIRTALLATRGITEQELRELTIELDKLANDPNAIVFFPKIYQIYGTKV